MASTLVTTAETIGTAKVIAKNIGDADLDHLRKLADRLKEGIGSGVVILGGARGDRANLFMAVTKDLAQLVSADAVIKSVESIIDGRGGGRAESASAGGKAPARVSEAVDAARAAVRERFDGRRG